MRRKIDLKSSALLKALHQECGVSCAELCRRYKQFAPRIIYRHATAKGSCEDRRHANPGRPRKLDCRDERLIVRTLKRLRKERASFSAKKIQEEAALFHVSLRTIHRTLRKFGYKYRQSRKKGLLSQLDKVKRLQYARRVKRFGQQFWEEEIWDLRIVVIHMQRHARYLQWPGGSPARDYQLPQRGERKGVVVKWPTSLLE